MVRKILVISDLHGNPDALDAVLAAHRDAAEIWAPGDYISFVPYPDAVVRTLMSLENLTAVKGNWEHQYLAWLPEKDAGRSASRGASARVDAIMDEGFRRVTPMVTA